MLNWMQGIPSVTGKVGRVILAFAFYLCAAIGYGRNASAHTGFDPLDTQAIAVKKPATVELVAITRFGQRLFAVGVHGVIILSDDSGETWRQASVPVDVLLTDIFFTSPTDGWAVGHYGAILHSTDGGLTWTVAATGLDVIRLAQQASAQFQKDAPGSPQAALELRVATAYAGVGPSKPFLAVGKCAGGVLAAGQQDMAMLTNDDGKSWSQWTSNIANPHFNNIYDILSDGASTFLVGEQGMVLESDGQCMNFRPLTSPTAGTLFGGVLVGQNALLVYGLDGGLFLTDDDGKTWQTLQVPSDTLIDSSVKIPTGQVLLGTIGGFFYVSDAGVTAFHRLSVSEPFQISGLALAPDGNVIVIGTGGVTILDKKLIQ